MSNEGWTSKLNAFAPQSSGPIAETDLRTAPKQIEIPAHIIALLDAIKEPRTKDGLLVLHTKLKNDLDTVKANEMEVRKLAAAMLLETVEKKEGMNNVELGGGYVAKVQVTVNRKLVSDKPGRNVVDCIDDCIDDFAKLDNEGPFIAQRLFIWQAPTLSVTELRKLETEAKDSPTKQALLDRVLKVLEVSEAAPTLEIKAPKGSK
jgi:hypothetical protein